MQTATKFALGIVLGLGACGDDGGEDSDASATGTSNTASTATASTSDDGTTVSTADGSTGSSDGGSSEEESTGGTIPIPDPGDGMDDWFAMGDVSTPDMAWPVGIATMSPGYIEAMADEDTGNAFWVFEAGPGLAEIVITAVAFANPIEFIHLHDASGGVFGDEVMATSIEPCCGDGGFVGTWGVTPGDVYVFEVHVPGGALV